MRSIVLLFMICFSAAAAERTPNSDSLDSFARQMRHAYEQKDKQWLRKNSDSAGMPAELAASQQELFLSVWSGENLKVTSVKTVRAKDYSRNAAGEFRGRKLRFVEKPTHWVILKAASPKPGHLKSSGSLTSIELALPVLEKDGRWRVAGGTYATAR